MANFCDIKYSSERREAFNYVWRSSIFTKCFVEFFSWDLNDHPLLPTNHFSQYEENDIMISFTQKRYFNCSSWSNTCLSNFSYEYPAFFLSLLLLRYCGHCDFVMKGNETLFTNFCWLKPSILRFSLSQVEDWSFTSLESFIFTSIYSKVYCKHE